MFYHQLLTRTATPTLLPLADMDTIFTKGGRALPESYRQYAQEQGYGLLCNLFIVYLPLDGGHENHPDSWFVQRQRISKLFQHYLEKSLYLFKEDESYPELVAHAEPFARSENGDFLFWDTRQVLHNGEMPIYCTDFSSGICHAGNNLFSFIKNVTSAQRFKAVLPFHTQSLPATFKPLTFCPVNGRSV